MSNNGGSDKRGALTFFAVLIVGLIIVTAVGRALFGDAR